MLRLEDGEKEDLTKVSVAELKKRLFWCGASLPAVPDKAELIAAVRHAESEKRWKDAQAARLRQEREKQKADQSKPAPPRESRPLDFDQKIGTEEDQEIVALHCMTEAQLREKIEEHGHDVPRGEVGKHYLVALAKKAVRNKRPKKEKPPPGQAPEDDVHIPTSQELMKMKRPTVGDFVEIVANDLMKRYCPNEVGKVFKIIKDDGGHTPYRLARCEARHWFSESDIKWPNLDNKPVRRKKASSLEKPADMPKQVMIMQDRYGCQAGELKDVKGQTGDQQSWMLTCGKQVPKAHEGVGWSRVEPQETQPDAPPPPPPPQHSPSPAPAPQTSTPTDAEVAPAKVEEDTDPVELSPEEIKRQLLRYGPELLGDLSEKGELADALREARRTRGRLPPEKKVKIAYTEDEIMAQMEEMQTEMDREAEEAALAAPAASPATATAETAVGAQTTEVAEASPAVTMSAAAALAGHQPDLEAAARAGVAAAVAAAERAQEAAKKAEEESQAAAAAVRPGEKRRRNAAADQAARAARIAAARAARKAPPAQQAEEVLLSDGEDDVTAVGTAAAAPQARAPRRARKAAGAADAPAEQISL